MFENHGPRVMENRVYHLVVLIENRSGQTESRTSGQSSVSKFLENFPTGYLESIGEPKWAGAGGGHKLQSTHI
jgi:hypothetical protein